MLSSSVDVRSSIPYVPELLITGGQLGADYGALLAAKSLGIPTGGFAPLGFKTEQGLRPELGTVFGLLESASSDYAVRTRQNIELCNALILIANKFESPGTRLTARLAFDYWVPVFEVPYSLALGLDSPYLVADIRSWLKEHTPGVLMCAGNRESVAPGIERWTQQFLRAIFVD